MKKDTTQLFLEGMNRVVNVREYENRSIAEDVVEGLLYSFSLGPSSANCQPWELFIPREEAQLEKIVQATLDPFLTEKSYGAQGWISKAPFVAIVLMEKRRSQTRIGEKGDRFAAEDIFSAIQNFRLIADTHDLATSVVREFDPLRLNESLELPWYVEPLAILTAGYTQAELEIPERLQINDFVHWGRWQ
ncbi:nitroreductase family protein [Bacillus horti]|uniref:5,6-dimethylbenzimidazole synthase n=1 Tax=Caldalkalibacillus horti TaxID=77523 RepID=A0ABT9VYM8_9BACI|nr:nitroreductase family protein [Bacillus horti]MDQ0165932.1 5,6-dimethylbenzimidazole synthase [Bacillus horti]